MSSSLIGVVFLACSEGPSQERLDFRRDGRAQSIPPSPCPGANGLCFRDTTRHYIDQLAEDRGTWVVFAGAGDSSQLFSRPDTASASTAEMRQILGGASLDLFIRGPGGKRVKANSTSSPVAIRFPESGVYTVEVSLQGGTDPAGLPYTLRIVPIDVGPAPFAAALPPRGRARLIVEGEAAGFVALIPNSVLPQLSPADYGDWAIWAGDFSVLLVSDTLYRTCRLPCTKLDSVVLRPGAVVRKHY